MPDPPIVINLQTTVADFILWGVGQIASWTLGDVLGWSVVCIIALIILRVIGWWFRKSTEQKSPDQ